MQNLMLYHTVYRPYRESISTPNKKNEKTTQLYSSYNHNVNHH